jgi:peptide/nickel transport system permease protein
MSQQAINPAHYPSPPGVVKRRLPARLYRTVGLAGLSILLGLLLLALFPGAFAPYDPAESVGRPFRPPSRDFLLGTNDIGQDLLSELIWGTRASLFTGLLVGLVAVTIGVAAGLVSGFYDNWLSTVVLRLVDLTLVLPFLPLVILLSAYLDPRQRNIIIILILVSWAGPARLTRSGVLAVLNSLYVEAARALGSSDRRLIIVHIWPATRSLALVQLVTVTAAAILAEASLSFLGLGDPSTKSWGTTLYFAQASGVFMSDAWLWWVLPTGLLISGSVLSLVLVAFLLEQRFEPRLRRR